jgi:hypothetical protein
MMVAELDYKKGISVVAQPLSQLAKLMRYAFNPAQSGFESIT